MTSSEKYTDPQAEANAPADPYAPTAWGQYDEELTVSSGQRCRVKKLDFSDVMDAGLLDKLNTLQGVVEKHTKKAEGQPPVDPMKMLSDKRTSKQFSTLIDDVVIMCVTAPKLERPPAKVADRKAGVVYVDTVGLVDKMEIFQHALGDVEAMSRFRGGAAEPVQRMADGEESGQGS